MSSIETDVNITINSDDKASAQIETSAAKINKAWKSIRDEQRLVQRQFEVNNQTFIATTRVMNQVGSIVGRLTSLYNTYTLMQIRNQDAARNLSEEQRGLNEVLAEFGPNSEEFVRQLDRIKAAEEQVEAASRDTAIGYALIIAQIATLSGRLPTLISRLKGLKGVLGGKGAAAVASKSAVGGVGSATGAAGAAGAGAAASKIPSIIGKAASISAGVATGGALIGLDIASNIQEAGGGGNESLPGGLDAFGPAAGKLSQIINNIVINAPTAEEIIKTLQDAVSGAVTFRGS